MGAGETPEHPLERGVRCWVEDMAALGGWTTITARDATATTSYFSRGWPKPHRRQLTQTDGLQFAQVDGALEQMCYVGVSRLTAVLLLRASVQDDQASCRSAQAVEVSQVGTYKNGSNLADETYWWYAFSRTLPTRERGALWSPQALLGNISLLP
jgi:hypothetical protein